jgi:hypothetical protein
MRRSLLLACLAMAMALAAAPAAQSSYPPRNCGVVGVHGKSFRVKSHFVACRHARYWSRRILAGRRGPRGWSCRRYSAKVTRIAFNCRRSGGRDFYAIRR